MRLKARTPKGAINRAERPAEVRLERQRIDKWLWFARFVRTRPLAVQLVECGHVRLNGTRVTDCAHPVKRGDVLTVALARTVAVVTVVAFTQRRGPAVEAVRLYATERVAEDPPGQRSERS